MANPEIVRLHWFSVSGLGKHHFVVRSGTQKGGKGYQTVVVMFCSQICCKVVFPNGAYISAKWHLYKISYNMIIYHSSFEFLLVYCWNNCLCFTIPIIALKHIDHMMCCMIWCYIMLYDLIWYDIVWWCSIWYLWCHMVKPTWYHTKLISYN